MRKRLIFLSIMGLLLYGCAAGGADRAPAETAAPQGALRDEAIECSSESTPPAEAMEPVMDETKAAATVAETGEGSGSNYFVFNRSTNITTADDGTELLYEYNCDGVFSAPDPELDQWVNSVLDSIRGEFESNSGNLVKYASEYLKNGEKDTFYSYSNYLELGITRHDSKGVSLVALSSVYSGGAHPNTVQTAYNLDMMEKKILTLTDILIPGTEGTIAKLVLEIVEEKFLNLGENALFQDYKQVIERAFVSEQITPYWYLNENGLVIFFNQYELGPYAAGIIKTEIPYESLDGILQEAYYPGKHPDVFGDLLLRGDWDGYRKIPITVERDGDRILIGIEGQVFQIQLSEIYWLEGTAIGQKMLFSGNNLTQNDVLELTGGYDDETRSFAVEFADGEGNVTLYYIHPEGLTDHP